jgi:hypothetical protein
MALYDTPGLFYDSGVFYDVVTPPPLERKRMAKVKVGLKNLSREEIADKLNTVKTAMTGNPNFLWLFQLRSSCLFIERDDHTHLFFFLFFSGAHGNAGDQLSAVRRAPLKNKKGIFWVASFYKQATRNRVGKPHQVLA